MQDEPQVRAPRKCVCRSLNSGGIRLARAKGGRRAISLPEMPYPATNQRNGRSPLTRKRKHHIPLFRKLRKQHLLCSDKGIVLARGGGLGGGGGAGLLLSRGGRGTWTQNLVYQKWPDQIFPIVNFVFSHHGHFGLGRGGGGFGEGPPPWFLIILKKPWGGGGIKAKRIRRLVLPGVCTCSPFEE